MKKLLPAAITACLFLLIVGAKWATFDRFGSPMPDWDQWDAEAMELFVPWFKDDHFLQHLFHPHNEHRVILTKLQNLGLVLLNGQWDSRLEAVTNALLHGALAVGFWVVAKRWLASRWQAAIFILLLALFGLPLAWQNILGGFHSQQYWLLGLSFIAITLVPFVRPWTGAWWWGSLCASLALGSMGSGFLAAGIVLVVVAVRVCWRETSLRETWPTFVLMAAIVALGWFTRVEVDWHQKLKAKTAHDFIFSIVHSLQWPLREAHWAAPIMWLPWLLVSLRLLRPRSLPEPERKSGLWLVALGAWVLVQLVATAYARGAGAEYPASRYMDTLSFGAIANALALGWLFSSTAANRLAWVGYAAGLAWLVTLTLGLRQVCERNLRYELPDAKKYYLKAEGHMRRYLATNDPKQLAYPDIPFPSAQGLMERLAIPSIRQLMPLPIRATDALTPANADPGGFTVNDARGDVSETPPRRGLPPAAAALDAAVSWGSFGADGVGTKGEWRSAAINPPPFRWLKFETAGDLEPRPGNDISLTLHDAQTGERLADVRPTRRPGDTWRAAYVRTPNRPFVVVALDQSAKSWLGFSPPAPMGAASHWAWQVTKHAQLMLYVVAGALVVLLILQWRVRAAKSHSDP